MSVQVGIPGIMLDPTHDYGHGYPVSMELNVVWDGSWF
jgi:hypothetical protein